MSTYQTPEGTPPYVPPQDPWATVADQGVVSLPTDPIPHQHGLRDPYAVPTGQHATWSGQTERPDEQSHQHTAPSPARRKAGYVAALVALVVVLGGGTVLISWWVITTIGPFARPGASSTAESTVDTPSVSVDPHQINVNDCIINKGTLTKPQVEFAACTAPASYKVIKRVDGESIVENRNGTFDAETTSVAACSGTGFESWYSYKHPSDPRRDVFFCLINNR